MGMKSRGNWLVGCCLKECSNRGVACTRCIRFSQFSPIKDQKYVLAVENDTQNNSIESTNQLKYSNCVFAVPETYR